MVATAIMSVVFLSAGKVLYDSLKNQNTVSKLAEIRSANNLQNIIARDPAKVSLVLNQLIQAEFPDSAPCPLINNVQVCGGSCLNIDNDRPGCQELNGKDYILTGAQVMANADCVPGNTDPKCWYDTQWVLTLHCTTLYCSSVSSVVKSIIRNPATNAMPAPTSSYEIPSSLLSQPGLVTGQPCKPGEIATSYDFTLKKFQCAPFASGECAGPTFGPLFSVRKSNNGNSLCRVPGQSLCNGAQQIGFSSFGATSLNCATPINSVCDPTTQLAPDWGVVNNQCLPSCSSLGGTAQAASCAGLGMTDLGQTFDAPFCCKATSCPAGKVFPDWQFDSGLQQCLPSCGIIAASQGLAAGQFGGQNGPIDPTQQQIINFNPSGEPAYDVMSCFKRTAAPTPCDATQLPPDWTVVNGQCLPTCKKLTALLGYPLNSYVQRPSRCNAGETNIGPVSNEVCCGTYNDDSNLAPVCTCGNATCPGNWSAGSCKACSCF